MQSIEAKFKSKSLIFNLKNNSVIPNFQTFVKIFALFFNVFSPFAITTFFFFFVAMNVMRVLFYIFFP